MIDRDELTRVADQGDPAFLELTEQIADQLRAGDEINVRDYLGRYPQWAEAILQLLPTMHELVEHGRTVDRERHHRKSSNQERNR